MPRKVVISKSEAHPHHFQSPFAGDDYVLLIVIFDPTISEAEQEEVSRTIIQTGCRYSLAFGYKCSSWDDSIDNAYIEGGENPNRFVMTTWHDDEPIDDVIDFWWFNTTFDNYMPDNFAVFFIGSDPLVEEALHKRIEYFQKKNSEQ